MPGWCDDILPAALRLMIYGATCLAMLLSDMRLDAYQLHPESWFLFIAVRIMAYTATLFLRAVDHGQTERLRFEQAPLQESVALDRARIAHARTATEMAAQIKSQFLATMSHEISTPMNGVIGLAELLAETPLDPMQRQYVSTIVVSSRALLTSIDDVLDLAKLQAGKFDLTVETFSIKEAVARALDLLRPTAMKKAIRLQANLQSADHPHLGESGRLRQILLNLLGNTVKSTATGSVTVSVQIRPDDALDQIRITITDSGIGIAADRLRLR